MGNALEPITTQRWTGRLLPVWVFLTVLLAQSPLIFNPGYFSHDELQWAAFAAQDPERIWREHLWLDVQSFQYRPLTFTVWLWLSKHLFAHPYAFHAVAVAMGAANAALLAALLRGWRVPARSAFAGSCPGARPSTSSPRPGRPTRPGRCC